MDSVICHDVLAKEPERQKIASQVEAWIAKNGNPPLIPIDVYQREDYAAGGLAEKRQKAHEKMNSMNNVKFGERFLFGKKEAKGDESY